MKKVRVPNLPESADIYLVCKVEPFSFRHGFSCTWMHLTVSLVNTIKSEIIWLQMIRKSPRKLIQNVHIYGCPAHQHRMTDYFGLVLVKRNGNEAKSILDPCGMWSCR